MHHVLHYVLPNSPELENKNKIKQSYIVDRVDHYDRDFGVKPKQTERNATGSANFSDALTSFFNFIGAV